MGGRLPGRCIIPWWLTLRLGTKRVEAESLASRADYPCWRRKLVIAMLHWVQVPLLRNVAYARSRSKDVKDCALKLKGCVLKTMSL